MSLSLTFLGQLRERWRVRVELSSGFRPSGLTVGLVSESGRRLGPVVVMPDDVGCCWIAELRGPRPLPAGTKIVASADIEGGEILREEVRVDSRRGLHAFLHADARLPLETDPKGAALSDREIRRLSRLFPWVTSCGARAVACQEVAEAPVSDGGWRDSGEWPADPPPHDRVLAGDDLTRAEDDLLHMLHEDFGVDIDTLDEDALDGLRR